MTDSTECGQVYEYTGEKCSRSDGHKCARPKHPDWEEHQCADGFRWLHHEDFIAAAGTGDLADDLYEVWDEPVAEDKR